MTTRELVAKAAARLRWHADKHELIGIPEVAEDKRELLEMAAAIDALLSSDAPTPPSERADWTRGPDGRSNTSALYEELVAELTRRMRDLRIGDRTDSDARAFISWLAHNQGFSPRPAPTSDALTKMDGETDNEFGWRIQCATYEATVRRLTKQRDDARSSLASALAAERERCARACETAALNFEGAISCAARIRALGAQSHEAPVSSERHAGRDEVFKLLSDLRNEWRADRGPSVRILEDAYHEMQSRLGLAACEAMGLAPAGTVAARLSRPAPDASQAAMREWLDRAFTAAAAEGAIIDDDVSDRLDAILARVGPPPAHDDALLMQKRGGQ